MTPKKLSLIRKIQGQHKTIYIKLISNRQNVSPVELCLLQGCRQHHECMVNYVHVLRHQRILKCKRKHLPSKPLFYSSYVTGYKKDIKRIAHHGCYILSLHTLSVKKSQPKLTKFITSDKKFSNPLFSIVIFGE